MNESQGKHGLSGLMGGLMGPFFWKDFFEKMGFFPFDGGTSQQTAEIFVAKTDEPSVGASLEEATEAMAKAMMQTMTQTMTQTMMQLMVQAKAHATAHAMSASFSEHVSSFSNAFLQQWGWPKLSAMPMMEPFQEFGTLFEGVLKNTFQSMLTPHLPFVVAPERGDGRFQGEGWRDIPLQRVLVQLYLLMGRFLRERLEELPLEETDRKQMVFWLNQWIDAVSPSNVPFLNPNVAQKALETGGSSLVTGFSRWIEDLQKKPEDVFLGLTKPRSFHVGKNIAFTSGKIIFQNEIMQLIHYQPTKADTFQVPLLIVPPWINKFYIFDLGAQNSFVRWALENGHAVFLISWVNPRADQPHQTFESYLKDGVLRALDIVLQITQAPQSHLMGLCVGGNLVAAALAYLKAQKREVVRTATFLATLLDFKQAGDSRLFTEPNSLAALKQLVHQEGFLDGALMAFAFSLLRSQDMIWAPMIKRYFLGEDPPPLDFLFWNSDPLRIPGPLHLFFLETFYQENTFKEKGGLVLDGMFCDWRAVDVPRFTVAALKDHIAPWKGCFPLTFGEKDAFVLSTSGHIAGVINPPASDKYSYWTGAWTAEGPDTWQTSAQETRGSWWPHWHAWVSPFSGPQVPAQIPGIHPHFPAQQAAPGSYVQEA